MLSRKAKVLIAVILSLAVIDYVVWSQVSVQHTRWSFDYEWSYDSLKTSTVSIVRSDNEALDNPVPLTDSLSYDQVLPMVRRAIDLVGGLESYLEPGDSTILIKPNIVDVTVRGNGCVTDWRVVKALIEILYGINPNFEIIVGEGAGGWARPGTPYAPSWSLRGDGYVTSGYRDMIESMQSDPDFPGLNLSWVDLNYDEIETVTAATPRLSDTQTEFYLPRTVMHADFFINVPVLKVHSTGITVGLKNYVGVLPGMVYGWSKDNGYNNNGKRLDHSPRILQKNFVDVVRNVGCDFVLVDGIICKEKSKFPSGIAKRRNLIVASSDIVSIDAVCARLMDINPDDVEHVVLAAMTGVGQNDLDKITILGDSLTQSSTPFIKAANHMDDELKNSSYPYYGLSNRTWLLNGPYIVNDLNDVDLPVGDENVQPVAGQDGWSGGIFFYDDLIDPAGYYQDTLDCVYYAFTYLEAPETRDAKLWVSSSNEMTVLLNGQEVYSYNGLARYHKLPNDVVDVQIEEGLNTVLVKVKQTAGTCTFSLNICEPETNVNYAGNRLAGIRFVTSHAAQWTNGDYDHDGRVDIFDLLSLLNELGKTNKDPLYDYNADSRVDIFDLLGLLKALEPGQAG